MRASPTHLRTGSRGFGNPVRASQYTAAMAHAAIDDAIAIVDSASRSASRLSEVGVGDNLEAGRASHHVEWSLLHFVVNAPDELTDHADADELHSAQEEDHNDCRRPPARSVLVSEEFFPEEIEKQNKADHRREE